MLFIFKSVTVFLFSSDFVVCISISATEVLFCSSACRLAENHILLSTPMGVVYVIIAIDMEVQPLVTHNAA